MGICLGLQLFFATSEEAPDARGLGILPGGVARFATDLPVPHVGWARVDLTAAGRRHPMLAAVVRRRGPSSSTTCTAITRAALPDDDVLATGTYERAFPDARGQRQRDRRAVPSRRSRSGPGIELLDAFARWRP